MKGEQSIGEAPAEIDYSGAATAGQGATQYRKITPKPEGAGALPIGTGVLCRKRWNEGRGRYVGRKRNGRPMGKR